LGVGGTLPGAGGAGSSAYTYRNTSDDGYTFDNDGKLIEIFNDRGELLTLEYPDGRLTKVTETSFQRYLTFRYDGQGRLSRVLTVQKARPYTSSDRYIEFGYDPQSGDLASVRDVRGQVWTYEYTDTNHPHHLTARRDPANEFIVSHVYDLEGRAVEETNGEGEVVVSLTFNPDGTTTVTDG